METNQIYKIDCLIGMKMLSDESINCIITDPPYGDNILYGRNNKEIENNENPLLNCQMLWESQRILKNNSCIYNFTNWKHYPFLTEFIIRYTCFNIRMIIVLKKSNFGLGYGFRNQHEFILVLEKGNPVYYTNSFSNVMDFPNEEKTIESHPHVKNKENIRNILEHSTKEGDLVLDCFVGSGTILLACKQLNRKFIGFEIDDKWYKVAKEMLKQNILSNTLKDIEKEETKC